MKAHVANSDNLSPTATREQNPVRAIEELTSPTRETEGATNVECNSAEQEGGQRGDHKTKEQSTPCSPQTRKTAMEVDLEEPERAGLLVSYILQDADSAPKDEQNVKATPKKPIAAEYGMKKASTPKDDKSTCSIMKATAVPMRER